jgi:hypothetical protein
VTCFSGKYSVNGGAAGTALGAGALAVLVACNGPAANRPTGIEAPPPERTTVRRQAVATDFLDLSAPIWGVESDHRSVATFSRDEPSGRSALVFRYELGPGHPVDQFAALVASVPHDLSRYDRITFRALASRPLRLAVTLRPEGTNNPPRWHRSVYLDHTPRNVTVFFDDMRAVPRDVEGPVPLASIGALMFIIDTNNTTPGTSGEITLSEMAYGY